MPTSNRREILINRMNDLESQGMGCVGCSGKCCTYEANSMLITPLEAMELIKYLKENQLMSHDLKHRLKEARVKYRLEPRPLVGKRSYLRKTYTCPFFNHRELGCPLPREIKPYGCLAFDSHHEILKASEHCYSETDLLARRDEQHPEEAALNDELRSQYQLFWEKSPIPNALLELLDKFSVEDL